MSAAKRGPVSEKEFSSPEMLGDLPGQQSWARAFGVSVARGSALRFDARLGFQGAQIVPLSC